MGEIYLHKFTNMRKKQNKSKLIRLGASCLHNSGHRKSIKIFWRMKKLVERKKSGQNGKYLKHS
jgi:hypothetical protein